MPVCGICVKPTCAHGVIACVFQAAKLAKMKVPPSEMFLSESDKYSKFDENVRIRFVLFITLVDPLHWGGRNFQPWASFSVWGAV